MPTSGSPKRCTTDQVRELLALMQQYRVPKLRVGDVELEMIHLLAPERADAGPTFQEFTGVDPLGTPRERRIAEVLAGAAREMGVKDLENEDGYAD